MNKALKPFWFLLIVFVAVTAFSILKPRPSERIPWRTDLDKAKLEARQSNKPLMIYFTADWCGPCQTLKTTTWADADVEKALADYIPVKIDVDQSPSVAQHYGTAALPRFVIAKSDGESTSVTEGAYPPREFIEWLKGNAM
jgi:thioredoxin 1